MLPEIVQHLPATIKGRDIDLPERLSFLWEPKRFKVAYGGRGSAKSWSAAQYCILRAMMKRERILCVREFQSSIRDSVHKLISDIIEAYRLERWFSITQYSIRCINGSEFLFAGLANNSVESIKSYEGMTLVWIEEAQRLSQRSLDILIPTIRLPGSEFVITYNPENEDDPVHKRFVVDGDPEAIAVQVNWYDNPWFPDVLRIEMDRCKAVDYEKYQHVWLGQTRRWSDSQVFKGKFVVEDFSSEGVENFLFGADWGFAKDPTTLNRTFIRDGDLFVDQESYGYGVELCHIPALFRKIPGADRYRIEADNSRPETIAYLKRPEIGPFNIYAAPKWPGSVEDGIEFMRQFRRIVIHPRCKNTIYEFGAYSFKIDKITGAILPIVVDAHNHCIDAIRYSLSRHIKRKTTIYDGII